MPHSGKNQPSDGAAVLSYLTFWRSVFNFLVLVLVNLQEIVNFNTEGRKGRECSDLRGLLFREEEEEGGVSSEAANSPEVRFEAHQPNLSEQQLKLPTHNRLQQAEPDRKPTARSLAQSAGHHVIPQ